MSTEVLVRYSSPTKYDLAPYGTICQVLGDNAVQEALHIQVGHGETSTWITMGEFLEKVFKDKLLDASFIQECLQSYK